MDFPFPFPQDYSNLPGDNGAGLIYVVPIAIALILVLIAIVEYAGWTDAKELSQRVREHLGPAVTTDLTSIQTWMKVHEASEKNPLGAYAPKRKDEGPDYQECIELFPRRSRGKILPS